VCRLLNGLWEGALVEKHWEALHYWTSNCDVCGGHWFHVNAESVWLDVLIMSHSCKKFTQHICDVHGVCCRFLDWRCSGLCNKNARKIHSIANILPAWHYVLSEHPFFCTNFCNSERLWTYFRPRCNLQHYVRRQLDAAYCCRWSSVVSLSRSWAV